MTATTIAELGSAFAEFQKANDQRLAEIEKKGSADVVLNEKVDRINSALTQLEKDRDRIDTIEASVNRAQFGGGVMDEKDKAKAEHKAAFDGFFRKGTEGSLRDLEVNAGLTTQSDPDGGYIVPEEMDTNISRVLGVVSSMRQLARVVQVGSATYKKLHNNGGTSSGWVGEAGSRTETGTPSISQLEFPTMELYANPAATQSMLDDAMFDAGAWLSDEVAIEFAEQEGEAFITGNGVNKPRGILGYDTIANSSHTWGKVGFVATGASGAFASAPAGGDALISLQHAVRSGYRNNGSYLMSDATLEAVRKLKNSNGDSVFNMSLAEGMSSTVLGKPVFTDDSMPDIAANTFSVAFGDFNRGYLITDRMGARVLRDPYTNKPYVMFYTTKRVGGGIQDFAAIKLLKFA